MCVCVSDDLALHSRSQMHLKLDYFLTCNISGNITLKLGTTVGFVPGLKLDLDFENVCKACPTCLHHHTVFLALV